LRIDSYLQNQFTIEVFEETGKQTDTYLKYYDNTASFQTLVTVANHGYAGGSGNTLYTKTAAADAVVSLGIFLRGGISISTGGIMYPGYILSVAPGGAYTTDIGSYFKISPLISGINKDSIIGTWS
jgi:hypothetical protein